MICKVFWILPEGAVRLGIMPRPRGGEWLGDEIHSLQSQGVHMLVSLLTDDEVSELELTDEARHCSEAGIDLRSFPITDRRVPRDSVAVRRFVGDVHQASARGATVVLHCRGGIGRASITAALVLNCHGVPVSEAFQSIAAARGCTVPDTAAQAE